MKNRRERRYAPKMGIALALLAVCGCDSNQAVPLPGPTWSVASEQDPMTDAAVRSATAMFSGQRFNVQVQVTCSQASPGPLITYAVTSYDRNGQPAEMRSMETLSGIHQSLQARADSDAPFYITEINPRFNNQITTSQSGVVEERSGRYYRMPASLRLARASRVVLRLSMLTGDETIELSQQDGTLRGVIDPCLAEVDRQRDPPLGPRQAAQGEVAADAVSSAPQPASSPINPDTRQTGTAERSCRARVLRDVAAIEAPDSIMRRGETWSDVTQFWRNRSTGDTWFCAHGDYCYPSHVRDGSRRIEAIQLLGCRVGNQVSSDGDEILYEVRLVSAVVGSADDR